MSGSFKQFIHSFSIDPESQSNVERNRKCFRIFGYFLLAIGIFVVPYAISKIEISTFKTDIQDLQDELKTLKKDVENQSTSKPATNLTQKISDLESQIQEVDNRTASFFNYKVVKETKSAFLKLKEKMTFEVS